MVKGKVSVIIPTYNRPDLLKRAIQSVFTQKYKEYEIVVVDDSTTNRSQEICSQFISKQIKYYRLKKRRDIGAKRNFGIKHSTGEFIAFLDDDDEWLPEKLQLQVNLFQTSDNNVGVVHTNSYVDNGSKILVNNDTHVLDQSTQSLLESNFILNSTSLIKRTCFLEIGCFDENLPYCEDWDLYIRISRKFKLLYINKPTAILHWKIDSEVPRGSLDIHRVTQGYQIFLAKHWDEYADPKVLSQKLRYIGFGLKSIGEQNRAKWYFLKAFLKDPKNILGLLLLCESLFDSRIIEKLTANFREKQPVEFFASVILKSLNSNV